MPIPIPHATVVGDGAMGTLCAMLLARNGTEVVLWGRSADHVAEIDRARENKRYLPGHRLPDSIRPVADAASAFESPTVIVSAVPCQFIRSIWKRLAEHVPKDVPIVCVAKGIEVGTLLRPTDIIRDCTHVGSVACLSGPSIAPEIAGGKPASVVVAASDPNVTRLVQIGLSTSLFRVYTSDDLTGVEIAGAVKNVVAIAAGISDGIQAGDNAKAALVTRGLVEITRLGTAMGASPHTFRGLAGIGDLMTTCISKIGRNRSAGERIGQGMTTDEAVAATSSVIEGIPTTRSVLELAARHDVEMPIVSAVASVLFDGMSPAEAIEALMTRPLHGEAPW